MNRKIHMQLSLADLVEKKVAQQRAEKRRQPPEEMEQWADALNARGLLEAGEHTMLIDW
jgi:hypothetical protein